MSTEYKLLGMVLKGKWAYIAYRRKHCRKVSHMFVNPKKLIFTADTMVDTVFNQTFTR